MNQIFSWLVDEGLLEAEIVSRLQSLGLRTDLGRPWCAGNVRALLRNEKYAGHCVYNQQSTKLGAKKVSNPPGMWVRKNGAFEGIVPDDKFAAAQQILR